MIEIASDSFTSKKKNEDDVTIVTHTFAKMERVKKLSSQFVRNTSNDPLGGKEALKEERSKSSFTVRSMTYFLDGGREMTQSLERMMDDLDAHPEFQMIERGEWYDQSHEQIRECTLKRIRRVYQMFL